jgi:diaminopimelate epimerase
VRRQDGGHYAIAMGLPEFEPARIPMAGAPPRQALYRTRLLDQDVAFAAVSMGNPHAVVEVEDVAAAPVQSWGPALQASGLFPDSVNVGFAQVLSRGRIALRVYERGSGETLACGSGACAAAVALMVQGRVDREVSVVLPGGELQIRWPDADSEVIMAGPATFVFEGEWTQ